MSQCVPNWDVEETVPSSIEVRAQPCGSSPYVAMSEYEMAELTWENGQLSMHGLGLRRGKHVQNPIKYGLLERPRTTAGTLESIVNLATQKDLTADPLHLSVLETDDQLDLVPSASACACACASACAVPPPPTTLPMDALVPTAGISTCGVVDSCSGAATCQRQPTRAVEDGDDRSVLNKPRFIPLANHHSLSVSTSGTFAGDCWHVPSGVDTCDRELSVAGGFTSTTSFCSQGNTFSTSARTCTDNTTTVDDHDSVCHTRPPKGTGKEEERKRGNAKSSSSNRRSRAAAIHNQSERKRRDKINQKMKTLQKMVPNANKTDKASMLDEVIDYLKQLQAQVNMMSRMSIPSMMMPQLAMQQQQQQLQMSMMAAAAATAPMGMGLGMGMGIAAIPGSIGMDINMNIHPMARQNLQAFLNPNPPFMPFSAAWPAGDVNNAAAHNRLPSQSTATAVIPTDPISTYLACQHQPVTVEAYSRMIAMIQQQQQLSSTSKH